MSDAIRGLVLHAMEKIAMDSELSIEDLVKPAPTPRDAGVTFRSFYGSMDRGASKSVSGLLVQDVYRRMAYAQEINARLAPKWTRILREIRDTAAFNNYMERHDFQHPDHVSKYAGMPGLDAHSAEVAYQLLLQSGRGAYKTPLALRGRK